MTTYIALLRGINVSGYNKIKMANLKQLLTNLGFVNIITYIQSGNVVFQTEKKLSKELETLIENAILNEFKLTITVLVFAKKEFIKIFKSNPFLQKKEVDLSHLGLTFLQNKPNLKEISKITERNSNSKDEFQVYSNCIYLYLPNGFAKTKLTNNLFERFLNTQATTRNWKTIVKLIELS